MTKKDLMKVLRGLPDNTEIVLADSFNDYFSKAYMITVDKRARVKKIVLVTNPLYVIAKDRLLLKSKIVYNEQEKE